MGTTLLISMLLLSFGWYIAEWYQTKRNATKEIRGEVSGRERSIFLSQPDRTESTNYQQPDDYKPQGLVGVGRLYYGTPGRRHSGRIRNGQILKTESFVWHRGKSTNEQ